MTRMPLYPPANMQTRLYSGHRWVAISLLLFAPLSWSLFGQSGGKTLADELKQRSATDGLALVGVARLMGVTRFDQGRELVENPRGYSMASFSENGDFVAWNILSRPTVLAWSPAPIVVDALDGTQLWQVPGCVAGVGRIGVSRDGRRIAFAGTYIPPGAVGEPERQTSPYKHFYDVRGLYYAESDTEGVRKVITFPPPAPGNQQVTHIKSISWSPTGDAFSYDDEDRIYIYDIATKSQVSVASGSEPAWSPDGQWIAFRSTQGRIVEIRPNTLETKVPLGGLKVEGGVKWSPDSQYLRLFELASRTWDLFHGFLFDPDRTVKTVVYRLGDGARLSFVSAGDQWVRDHRTFLKGASVPPVVRKCE
jgi:hypothetical protein